MRDINLATHRYEDAGQFDSLGVGLGFGHRYLALLAITIL
jgi:hypothetical protein